MNELKSITFKYEMNLRDKSRALITEISRGNFLFIIICYYMSVCEGLRILLIWLGSSFLGKFSSFTSIGLLFLHFYRIGGTVLIGAVYFGISEKRMVARVHTETFQA